jgi:hypothetical protein
MKSNFSKMKFSSFKELHTHFNENDSKKYHIKYGFPKGIKLPTGLINFIFSKHSKEAIQTDEYSKVSLNVSSYLNLAFADIFEIAVQNNEVIKFACRSRYNNKFDITMVIAIRPNDVYLLCTCWLNKKEDEHPHLKNYLYERCK